MEEYSWPLGSRMRWEIAEKALPGKHVVIVESRINTALGPVLNTRVIETTMHFNAKNKPVWNCNYHRVTHFLTSDE
jgi:hypothetical protein